MRLHPSVIYFYPPFDPFLPSTPLSIVSHFHCHCIIRPINYLAFSFLSRYYVFFNASEPPFFYLLLPSFSSFSPFYSFTYCISFSFPLHSYFLSYIFLPWYYMSFNTSDFFFIYLHPRFDLLYSSPLLSFTLLISRA